MKEAVRYSDAFKRNVVEKVERGMYSSLREAQRKNGIRGSKTLVNWIRKSGKGGSYERDKGTKSGTEKN